VFLQVFERPNVTFQVKQKVIRILLDDKILFGKIQFLTLKRKDLQVSLGFFLEALVSHP